MASANPLSLPRSVSTSRQFIVYGTDVPVRGALCNAGERAKAALLSLLQQPDKWKTPIVVNAQYPQANLPDAPRVGLYFNQTGFGLKLQLDLVIAPNLNGPGVERELLRAVILELMYRERPNLPAGTSYVHPPDWLLDGVVASSRRQDPAPFFEILGGVVAANKVIPLEQFLHQRPELLDSPSRQLFSAYSFALLALLSDVPENRHRLARFIADLPDSRNGVVADLRAHFPLFAGAPENAENAWSANIARIATPDRYQSLSLTETERELDRLLRVRFSDPHAGANCYRLEDYPRFIHLPSRLPVLNQLHSDLMLLATRSNPTYRQIILGYQEVVSALARNNTRQIAARLDQLGMVRKETLARMEKIDDYLNWFEATQFQTPSGAFAEYFKTAASTNTSQPRRRDAVSVYLDVIESQFQ